MERLFQNIVYSVVNFKLDLCCFVAQVKVGILLFGYYNFISSIVCIIAVATGSFPPLYMHAQQSFMDAEYVKSSAVFACCSELCASVLLMSGMYREDVILLKYFTYVGLGMAAASLLVYAMVLGVLDMLTTLVVFISLFYQVYLVLLVRSAIIEINEAEKRRIYRINSRQSYLARTSIIPRERYSIVLPEIPIIMPEDSPVLPVRHMAEPGTHGMAKRKSETNINDTDVTEEEDTAKKTVAMRYPFKFVAIKIPKETSKEEKVDDSLNKEITTKGKHKKATDKDVKAKKDEEVIKDINRPQRWSIFGRKKKEKIENSQPVHY